MLYYLQKEPDLKTTWVLVRLRHQTNIVLMTISDSCLLHADGDCLIGYRENNTWCSYLCFVLPPCLWICCEVVCPLGFVMRLSENVGVCCVKLRAAFRRIQVGTCSRISSFLSHSGNELIGRWNLNLVIIISIYSKHIWKSEVSWTLSYFFQLINIYLNAHYSHVSLYHTFFVQNKLKRFVI